MGTKLNLIEQAQEADTKQKAINHVIVESLEQLMFHSGEVELVEHATHVLANIATNAEAGKSPTILSQRSTADFLAGIDRLAQALPIEQDELRREKTLRVLAATKIDKDGKPNLAIVPIIELGAKYPALERKYLSMLAAAESSKDYTQLIQAVRYLQMAIDKATRS